MADKQLDQLKLKQLASSWSPISCPRIVCDRRFGERQYLDASRKVRTNGPCRTGYRRGTPIDCKNARSLLTSVPRDSGLRLPKLSRHRSAQAFRARCPPSAWQSYCRHIVGSRTNRTGIVQCSFLRFVPFQLHPLLGRARGVLHV